MAAIARRGDIRPVGSGRVIGINTNDAIQLEAMTSYDFIPLRIQALLQAMQNYEADLYFLNISGDAIVHNEGWGGRSRRRGGQGDDFIRLLRCGVAVVVGENGVDFW